MKSEKPAKGILKTGEFGSYKSYHVECECGSPECAHKLAVEADDMEVTVTIYLTLRTKWHNMSRWKQIWCILTKGYLDTEIHFGAERAGCFELYSHTQVCCKRCEGTEE